MRRAQRSILVLAVLATLGGAEAQGQAGVSFALSAGPLFTGVGFGFGGHHEAGSVFVGAAFGTAHPRYVGSYGVYSDPTYYSSGSCWDDYWNSHYDPYSGWYDQCVLAGPYRYSYRASSWRTRWT